MFASAPELFRVLRDAGKVSSTVTLAGDGAVGSVTAVGLDCRIQVRFPAEGPLTPTAINVAPALDALKGRPDQPPATIDFDGTVVLVQHGHLRLRLPSLPGKQASFEWPAEFAPAESVAGLLGAVVPVVERDGRHGVLVVSADEGIEFLGLGRQLHIAAGSLTVPAGWPGRYCMSRQAADHAARIAPTGWAFVDGALHFVSADATTCLRVSTVHDTYPASWRDLLSGERYLFSCVFDAKQLRFGVGVASSALSKADIALRMSLLGTTPEGFAVWELKGIGLVSKVEAAEKVLATPEAALTAWSRELAAQDLERTLEALPDGPVVVWFGEKLVRLEAQSLRAYVSTLT